MARTFSPPHRPGSLLAAAAAVGARYSVTDDEWATGGDVARLKV
eukprot:gene42494-65319_t